MTVVILPFALCCTFLWIGFVCAISFMEAWLKFRAPGISLPLGLGIGRLVFNALNKVELTIVILIGIAILWSRTPVFQIQNLILVFPIGIVLIQTFWLLPALDKRAQMHIDGKTVQPSKLHFYYVGLELLKVISLFLFGLSLINL